MRKLLIISAAIACAFSFGANAGEKSRSLTNEEKTNVEKAVKATLKDPDSATFKHTKLVLSGDGVVDRYCGMVNAKNSYGGYTGYSVFFVGITANKDGERVAIYLGPQEESDIAQQSVMEMCAKYGY
ncbi:hypothetical protein CHI95_22510 [Providencia rettgeri]|uniref:Secreted protein n=1 Tax=Providencia rettgeri TaxID=587 RepID=A0A264VLT9_PRORE|nr:hypothetical protein [Providencia rettgeri]OZS72283.1 hypothetical protein CHI95_22510 [Providencia rettgeri]